MMVTIWNKKDKNSFTDIIINNCEIFYSKNEIILAIDGKVYKNIAFDVVFGYNSISYFLSTKSLFMTKIEEKALTKTTYINWKEK